MARSTFNLLFLMRTQRTSKNGLAPILARITTNGQRVEISTQCAGDPIKWNQSKERCTGGDKLSQQVNACLTNFRVKILEIRQQLFAEGCEGNALEIKERFIHPRGGTHYFLKEFTLYCQKRQEEVGIRITQLTANKYHRLLRYLNCYVQERLEKTDLLLTAINYEFIDDFNLYLQTHYNCHHNGAVNLLCCLKNFIYYALRNEWIEKNPFQNYKLKEQHNRSKEHLTKAEIEIMIAKPMPNRRLEAIRDVFAFCAMTGLAFTDADKLRQEHLSVDEKGQRWIHKPREKTSVMSSIPLLPYPISILKKYEGDPICREKGKLLPVPSNTKMNAYLKEVATICNISKSLSTHCARHSFACLAVEYGMPIDVVAKILGHSSTNMTRHYAKFSESLIKKEMVKLGAIFNG